MSSPKAVHYGEPGAIPISYFLPGPQIERFQSRSGNRNGKMEKIANFVQAFENFIIIPVVNVQMEEMNVRGLETMVFVDRVVWALISRDQCLIIHHSRYKNDVKKP
jgi:hypothetical protein